MEFNNVIVFIGCIFLSMNQGFTIHIYEQGNCSVGHIQCPSSNHCVSKDYVCDGDCDCSDGSDETFCDYYCLVYDNRPEHDRNVARQSEEPSDSYSFSTSDLNLNDSQTTLPEVILYSQIIAVKLSKMEPKVYLMAEKLINQALYDAQMYSLTPQSNLTTAKNDRENSTGTYKSP